MHKIIYEPKGKAREYSPLAVNVYNGCDHGCKYCFAPHVMRKTKEQHMNVSERNGFLLKLEEQARAMSFNKEQRLVLVSFSGDPYCHFNEDHGITRKTLVILQTYGFPATVLTKGGKRCLQDLDIFKSFNGKFKLGQTLTMSDPVQSEKIEPGASLPDERIEVFRTLKQEGIKTWASIEPVLFTNQSLEMIERSLPYCDEYRIGKLNHYPKHEALINWKQFLHDALQLVRPAGKQVYIKKDLAKFDMSILRAEEVQTI